MIVNIKELELQLSSITDKNMPIEARLRVRLDKNTVLIVQKLINKISFEDGCVILENEQP